MDPSRNKSGSKSGRKNGAESGGAKTDNVQVIVLSPAGSQKGSPTELWRSGSDNEADGPEESQRLQQKDDRSLKGILKSPLKEPTSPRPSGSSGSIPAVSGSSPIRNAERVTRFRPPSALRKSHSVTDVRRMSLDLTSGLRNRRMSTSHVTHDGSRRSSMASITISLSRPDSLDSHILYEPEEDPLELHPAIPESQAGSDESSRNLTRHPPSSFTRRWSSLGHLQSARYARRNSCPGAVVWKTSPSAYSGFQASKSKTSAQRSPGHTSTRSSGVFLPASRPSSVLNGIVSARKSEAHPQIGCISRPWTPSTVSPPSGSRNWTAHRNPFQHRTALSMAAPLQALNAKVRNILGCTNNILDFYGKHPDADPNRSRIRAARITQSMKMNRRQIEPVVPVAKIIRPASKATPKRIKRPPEATAKKTQSAKKTEKPPIPAPVPPVPPVPLVPPIPPVPPVKKSSWFGVRSVVKDPAPEAPVPETPAPEASAPEAPAPEAAGSEPSAPPDATTVTNQIKVKWKTLASSSLGGTKEPAKIATPWKAVKVTKMRKAGAGNSGGGGAALIIDPMVSTLVQTLMRQRSDRTKKNRIGVNDFVPLGKLEQYTDKDRAAAVLLGDTDIKTTLEKQMKSERGRYVMPKESSAQVYLVQADFEMRIGGLATAHRLLNKVRIPKISSI